MRRFLAAVLLLTGLLGTGLLVDVGTARPASAHATVVTTSPAEDARLPDAPADVVLTFSEGVSVGAGYARVLGPGGDRVDTGAASVTDQALTVPLRSDLPDGSYVVTWRVVSADSHPVSGAYAFVVGDGPLVPATTADAGDDVDPVVGAALPAVRGLGYLGLALALGVPVFLVTCWPGGWASRLMRRLTLGGVAAVGVTALLTVALQGPYSAGTGTGGLLDPQLLATTTSSAFGATVLLRAVLSLLFGAVLAAVFRRSGPPLRPLLVVAGVLGSGLVLTTAAVGHPLAGSLPGLAVAITSVHVAAMAVWLGGLVALLAGLLRPGVPADEVGRALPGFSRIAFTAVSALVVSGVLQSVREVGSPAALVSTTYGRVLVAKLGLVLLVLAVAGVSRVWVQQRLGRSVPRRPVRRVTAHAFAAPTGPSRHLPDDEHEDDAAAQLARSRAESAVAEIRPFRRSVLIELVAAVAVLALSGVLVGTPPAAAAIAQPVDVTLALQSAAGSDGTVQLTVDPARPGANTVHVYLFDDAGRLVQPQDISVALTEPQQQIGPLDVDLEPAGPGHYIGNGASFPTAGRWTVTVSVRLDEFTAVTASTVVPVR